MYVPSQGVLIVRRGLSEQYYAYMRMFAVSRGLELIIDRRRQERRRTAHLPSEERRRGERRGPLPDSWDRADFIARPRAQA